MAHNIMVSIEVSNTFSLGSNPSGPTEIKKINYSM